MDCAQCGNELHINKEKIIHRKIKGEILRFHPWCWRQFQGSERSQTPKERMIKETT